jgi:multidrug efflux pump subunit AcrA (membrane-fusion protein)
VVRSIAKQHKESIEQFRAAGREDLATKEESELAILTVYLPPEMDEAQIDAIIDEATGAAYYEAMVEIPDEALAASSFQLLPGMPVEAMLRTESRNVLSYLVKPLTDSVSRTFRE